VFGPINIPYLGGYLYYISFVDELSRKTWLYYLKKILVFKKFKEFKSLVEKQTIHKMKVLMIDNARDL
jgi:hypothetical protein